MRKWDKIMDYIIDNGEGVHLWYSRELGWCYVSDRRGNRVKITEKTSIAEIDIILNKVKTGQTLLISIYQ